MRIFPLYYLVLAFFFFIAPSINNFPLDLSYYAHNQVWFWTFLQNWFLIFHNFGNTTSVLQHFWSLAVEEQFYIIWPWIILIVKKPKYLMIFAGTLLAGVIVTRLLLWNSHIQDLNYFGLYTFTRIDGICIGSMMALLMRINPEFLKKYLTVIVLSLAGINFLFFFLNRENSLPYLAIAGYTTFAIMLALLVYEAIMGENKVVNFILKIPPLRFIGKISFSFYVLHWPVYLIFAGYTYNWIIQNFTTDDYKARIITSITLTLAGFIVSVISYHGLEKQFLKLKKKLRY